MKRYRLGKVDALLGNHYRGKSSKLTDEEKISSISMSQKASTWIMAYLKEHQRATAAEIARLLGLSNARVRSLLQKMATEGVIEKIGNNRYTYYVLK